MQCEFYLIVFFMFFSRIYLVSDGDPRETIVFALFWTMLFPIQSSSAQHSSKTDKVFNGSTNIPLTSSSRRVPLSPLAHNCVGSIPLNSAARAGHQEAVNGAKALLSVSSQSLLSFQQGNWENNGNTANTVSRMAPIPPPSSDLYRDDFDDIFSTSPSSNSRRSSSSMLGGMYYSNSPSQSS